MSRTNIFSLPADPSSTAGSSSLREQIEAGLLGSGKTTVPGARPEDKQWAFKRSVPTVVLYDEEGLRLYDGITANAPEYYLFNDELNLLKDHGDAIARSMGFPGRRQPCPEANGEPPEDGQEEKEDRKTFYEESEVKPWKPARWGDVDVGKWNMGVNGEEGLAGGAERGYDVVELGAGALRKTAYLLTALSGALPPSSQKGRTAPITYHPLDLSKPELDRVLGEMDAEFGDQLKGKVDCIGLHGDYNAGLKYIREGKLNGLREATPPAPTTNGEVVHELGLEEAQASVSIEISDKDQDTSPSPPLTAASDAITPGPLVSPLPSAMTDETFSATSRDGTWTPLESETGDPGSQTAPAPATTAGDRPLHIVFLGSSLGNFPREEAAPFLASLPLRPGDTLLLGLDGRPAPGPEGAKKVEVAYNDPAGHTRLFEEHGWDVVRQELGLKGDPGVEFVGRYNEQLGRHEAYFKSLASQTLHLPGQGTSVTLEEGELLNIEWSYKYSLGEALSLFKNSSLRVINSWKAPDSEYRLWLLERPAVHFIELPRTMAAVAADKRADEVVLRGIPTWEQWQAMWRLWDHITLEMIPKEMLHQKPIDLRHICLFYLGHIPTFLDIHLTRLTGGQHTPPEHFKDIFERGIDPDVDDPTKIHDHSEVPACEEDWPVLGEILGFRDRVRERLRGIYDALKRGEMELNRHTGRVLFMTYEHEAMHAETLLYMLLQSPHTLPPTAVARPQWDALARRWDAETAENKVLSIPAGRVVLGHDDVENDDVKYTKPEQWESHEFGWDNENPRITVQVAGFRVDSLPISNAEYRDFLLSQGKVLDKDTVPAGWVEQAGEWMIRTLYGPVPFAVGGKWPVTASKLELDEFAAAKGGRLPTEEELRLLWEHPEGPRVAGPTANVGVKAWHPIPPAHTITDDAGEIIPGHNGGVWEWTSSEFSGYEGFSPSKLYPGYSADFFDGKHFVVLGGSFATIPALAGRKSFRNWYQANYRFSFIGARVVYPA